jgi:hypothetical protein
MSSAIDDAGAVFDVARRLRLSPAAVTQTDVRRLEAIEASTASSALRERVNELLAEIIIRGPRTLEFTP